MLPSDGFSRPLAGTDSDAVPSGESTETRLENRPGDWSRRSWLQAAGISLVAGAVAARSDQVPAAGDRRLRIKVGQIGVGHAHANKLSVFRASDDYEVVGIAEPDLELRRSAESQAPFRDLPWMTQEQLLNMPGLQLVLVETRVRDLLAAAQSCVAAGKHVHLDKPAGDSLPQLRRLLDMAAERRLLVQMGYMYRYNPGITLLRKFLREGWLGELFELHAVMSKVVGAAERQKLAEYPGGIMFELGCHLLDLVVSLLGEPLEVTSVVQHVSVQADALMDNMLAILSYERAIATVKSSALEVEGTSRRHLVVCGTEGTFQIQPLDNPSVRVALSRPRGEYRAGYQEISLPKYTRYVDDAADMAQVIRGEQEARFSYQHDLFVQEALLRACRLPVDK